MRLGIYLVALTLAAACSSTGTSTPSSTTPAPTTTAAKSGGLTVEVTAFGPSGTNVEVDFQATNTSGVAQRFTWADLVLTDPRGAPHKPYRDPTTAGYEELAPGGTFVDGAGFQFARFTPGKYTISYAGKALQSKTL